jgi:hypothetical protein
VLPRRSRHRGQIVGGQQVFERAGPVGHLACQLGVGREEGDRLGVLRQIRQLGAAMGGQGQHRQRRDAETGHAGGDEIDGVRQGDDDPVVPCDTEVGQARGELVGAQVQLAIGVPTRAGDHGDALRVGCGGAAQQVTEDLAAPVAGLAVSIRELLRPGGEACDHAEPPRETKTCIRSDAI